MPRIAEGHISHIAGVVPQMDDVDLQAVSIYATDAAPGDVAVGIEDVNRAIHICSGLAGTLGDANPNTQVRLIDTGGGARPLGIHNYRFNGTTWDGYRNNEWATISASAVRTATNQSAIQTNYNAKGVIVWLNVTVVPGADTVRLYVYALEPLTNTNLILGDTAVQVATGLFSLLVYPGAIDTGTVFTSLQATPLPRLWRTNVVHSGVGNFTYSVTCSYLD